LENIIILLSGIVMGAFLYRTLLVLRVAYINLQMFRTVELQCLQLLALSLEDAVFLKETKRNIMRQLKVFDENQIKVANNEDKYNLNKWKENSVRRLLETYPENYRGVSPFEDWSSAMSWLEKNKEMIFNNKTQR
jgi:hypothetical protein